MFHSSDKTLLSAASNFLLFFDDSFNRRSTNGKSLQKCYSNAVQD
jgi:hypothetical protein